MKEFILARLMELFLSQVTDEKLEESAKKFVALVKPWMKLKKDWLIGELKVLAQKSEYDFDDVAVEKLSKFLDEVLA